MYETQPRGVSLSLASCAPRFFQLLLYSFLCTGYASHALNPLIAQPTSNATVIPETRSSTSPTPLKWIPAPASQLQPNPDSIAEETSNLLFRHKMYQAFGTRYGCSQDASIVAMRHPSALVQNNTHNPIAGWNALNNSRFSAKPRKNHSNPTSDAPPTYIQHLPPPQRIALLFMVGPTSLQHPEIWWDWLREAREWSRRLFNERLGPYKNVPENASFVPLYSLVVHGLPVQKNSPTQFTTLQSLLRKLKRLLLYKTEVIQENRVDFSTGVRLGGSCPPSNSTKTVFDDAPQQCSLSEVQTSASGYPSTTNTRAATVNENNQFKDNQHKSPSHGVDMPSPAEEFQQAAVPQIHCRWGDLNPCEFQVLQYGLLDPHALGFIFLSETTIPVKPFQFIYKDFFKNPRSRFYFSNVDLPLIRKHHQWIVLNRFHAQRLIDHPEKWRCDAWLVHWYPRRLIGLHYAAPDEYLPFYALSDSLGFNTIFEQLNDGRAHNLGVFRNEGPQRGDRNFRHTWLCWWEPPEHIDEEPCDSVGRFITRLASPVNYYWLDGPVFEAQVLRNRNVWFARKFTKNCRVRIEVNNISDTALPPTTIVRPTESKLTSSVRSNVEKQTTTTTCTTQPSPRPKDADMSEPLKTSAFPKTMSHHIQVENLESPELLASNVWKNYRHMGHQATRYALASLAHNVTVYSVTLRDWLTPRLRYNTYFSFLPLHTYQEPPEALHW